MSVTKTTKTTKTLSVVKRESFFDDSFFTDAWDDFDKAVQSVLDKFDDTGLKVDVGSRNHCRDVYTKIRRSKIDEDLYASQALQITEKDGKFSAVMDVKDFSPSDLQVRVVEDRVVVEGKYIKQSEDGSSMSSKSFYKEFTLPPAADLDQVSTALSRDGVLTIRAPRKEGAAITEATPRAPVSSSTSSSTSSTQQQQFGDNSSTSSFKSTSSRRVIQSSSSFDSDGFDSLPKEMREKLMFCDSGFGSTKTSTCSSPAPSEAGSECSRVSSTMEFDLSKRAPVKTEVAFNVSKPSQGPPPQQAPPQQAHPPQSPPSYPQSPPPQPQPTHQYPSQQFQQFQQYPGQQYQSQGPPQYAQSPPPQAQYAQSPPPQYQSPPPQAQYQSPPPQFQSQPQYQSPPPQFQSPPPQFPQSPTQQEQYQSPQPQFQPQQSQFSQYQAPQQYTPQYPVSQSMPATGSGNQTSVSVTEENGRRVVTSQTSNVVQEKDGFKEHRETSAEITDKDSQAARREASTKLSKVEEDPEGKFKRAESTDAAEVSESCIQHLPDGSVMSVKKNSTSSSTSFKQSFSSGITGGDIMGGFFPQPPLPSNFPQGFDDFRNLMGRGHSLMSQMSTDSMGSTLSGRSGFTDMSNFSHFTDASSPFSDMSFGNMSNFSSRSKNFQQQQTQQQQQPPQQSQQQPQQQEFGSPRSRKGFSTSSSSSTSNFSQSFSSNFGDGNF